MDAIGGSKRCSRVGKTRYCFKCKRTVDSGHKFVWVPVNEPGYYRLQHRDCDFPDLYDHSEIKNKLRSARNARFFGRNMTLAQLNLLESMTAQRPVKVTHHE